MARVRYVMVIERPRNQCTTYYNIPANNTTQIFMKKCFLLCPDYVNETVQAVVGDVAKLYCNTAVTPNDAVTIIMWFRHNQDKPICR